ncbi:tyrosine-type recombinase/integrase [Bradyrhizobium sp. USDA 4452]
MRLLDLFFGGWPNTNKNANTSKPVGDTKKFLAGRLDVGQQGWRRVRKLAQARRLWPPKRGVHASDELKIHDLRHEGTSRLFEAGLSIEKVALVTDHKDWRTLRRYTKLKPEELHKSQTAPQPTLEEFIATLAASKVNHRKPLDYLRARGIER